MLERTKLKYLSEQRAPTLKLEQKERRPNTHEHRSKGKVKMVSQGNQVIDACGYC